MSVRKKPPVKTAPAPTRTKRMLRHATASLREFAYAVVSCGAVVGALVVAHRVGLIG
jgi:hypothetical protein